MNCARCKRPARRRGELETQYPGTVRIESRGCCSACLKAARKDGTIDQYPIGVFPAADNWTVQDCAGGCGARVRRGRLKIADYPNTILDAGGRRCPECRQAQFHNGRADTDAALDVARNREALNAWLCQKEALAHANRTRQLTKGLATCRL